MLAKLVIAAILVAIAAYFLLYRAPSIDLTPDVKQEPLKAEIIPASLLEFPNLRWNHSPIKVYINAGTAEKASYIPDVKLALDMWEEATGNVILFELTDDRTDADITINWVQKLRTTSLDAAGDTDLRFYNQTNFKIITHADIELLGNIDGKEMNDFDMTNLGLHEIGHALGLSHNGAEDSIMNPTLKIPSKEIKAITGSEIELLLDAYRLVPKTDIYIAPNSTVTKVTDDRILKKYYYINAVITIENRGLVDSKSTTMQILADGAVVKESDIPEIQVGAIFTRTYLNLFVENDFDAVTIALDPNNALDEYDKKNNVLVLKV